MADVKFCGLRRPEDAREAVRLGARYLGVIFAGGPRLIDPSQARAVLSDAPGGVQRVGVFGAGPAKSIAMTAKDAGVDVIQLHADPTPELVRAVRAVFEGPVWAVIRLAGDVIPAEAAALFLEADAVVLDARSDQALGGTGLTLPWARLAAQLRSRPGRARLVVAGGLNRLNVGEAIEELAPDIVDVSSGVESAPGVKDHSLMSAFMEAARSRTRPA